MLKLSFVYPISITVVKTFVLLFPLIGSRFQCSFTPPVVKTTHFFKIAIKHKPFFSNKAHSTNFNHESVTRN